MREVALNAVERAFDKSATVWRRAREGVWTLELTNGHRLAVHAQTDVEREWLALECSTGHAPSRRLAWTVMKVNALLPPYTRMVIRSGSVSVASELPLDGRERLAQRIASACAGLQHAVAALEGGAAEPAGGEREADEAATDPRAVIESCADGGWNVTERADGRWSIPLPGRGGGFAGLVERNSDGVHVWAELLASAQLLAVTRQALAMLLLETTGRLTQVRAVAEDGDRVAVKLGVSLGPHLDGQQLSHALHALALGCELTAAESRAMQDELVAERYLAFRGICEGAGDEHDHEGNRRRSV